MNGEDIVMNKYVDYLSRLLMISPVLIIGFKLGNFNIAILPLIIGIVLRVTSKKINENKKTPTP